MNSDKDVEVFVEQRLYLKNNHQRQYWPWGLLCGEESGSDSFLGCRVAFGSAVLHLVIAASSDLQVSQVYKLIDTIVYQFATV